MPRRIRRRAEMTAGAVCRQRAAESGCAERSTGYGSADGLRERGERRTVRRGFLPRGGRTSQRQGGLHLNQRAEGADESPSPFFAFRHIRRWRAHTLARGGCMSRKRTAGRGERPVWDVWPEKRASDAEMRRIAARISEILTAADAKGNLSSRPGGKK